MRGETTIRQATICRETKETQIALYLNLDGGERKIETGIGFFDHMLGSFAVHGGFGLILKCTGDLEVDGHHTVEDVGIALGQALARILGDRALHALARRMFLWTRRWASVHWISRADRIWFTMHPCRSPCADSMIPA